MTFVRVEDEGGLAEPERLDDVDPRLQKELNRAQSDLSTQIFLGHQSRLH